MSLSSRSLRVLLGGLAGTSLVLAVYACGGSNDQLPPPPPPPPPPASA
ncbi:MAG: hypothetical protein JWP97_2926, partial [Labilithrix sp.]|nr:hypothetical protein [Labilithrix sp.]